MENNLEMSFEILDCVLGPTGWCELLDLASGGAKLSEVEAKLRKMLPEDLLLTSEHPSEHAIKAFAKAAYSSARRE